MKKFICSLFTYSVISSASAATYWQVEHKNYGTLLLELEYVTFSSAHNKVSASPNVTAEELLADKTGEKYKFRSGMGFVLMDLDPIQPGQGFSIGKCTPHQHERATLQDCEFTINMPDGRQKTTIFDTPYFIFRDRSVGGGAIVSFTGKAYPLSSSTTLPPSEIIDKEAPTSTGFPVKLTTIAHDGIYNRDFFTATQFTGVKILSEAEAENLQFKSKEFNSKPAKEYWHLKYKELVDVAFGPNPNIGDLRKIANLKPYSTATSWTQVDFDNLAPKAKAKVDEADKKSKAALEKVNADLARKNEEETARKLAFMKAPKGTEDYCVGSSIGDQSYAYFCEIGKVTVYHQEIFASGWIITAKIPRQYNNGVAYDINIRKVKQ